MKKRFLLPLYALALTALVGLAVAQDKPAGAPAAPAAPTETTEKKEDTKSLLDHILIGGWIMVPIGICSAGTVYLLVDGWLRLTSKKRFLPEEHTIALRNLFRTGDYVGAFKFCRNNPSPLSNVVRAGIGMSGEGKNASEEAVGAEVAKENAQMQYFISYLSVIGVCTPMIGLLGTVFGMIDAFATLGTSGIGDPSKLSSAIGHVLVATAAGLLIAIPAFFGFYWLRNRSAKLIHDLQDTVAGLFKKMPYEHLAGAHIGDEEIYANVPNWVQQQPGEAQA